MSLCSPFTAQLATINIVNCGQKYVIVDHELKLMFNFMILKIYFMYSNIVVSKHSSGWVGMHVIIVMVHGYWG
jgi:hypothetical protein